jgi:hypothetical protein
MVDGHHGGRLHNLSSFSSINETSVHQISSLPEAKFLFAFGVFEFLVFFFVFVVTSIVVIIIFRLFSKPQQQQLVFLLSQQYPSPRPIFTLYRLVYSEIWWTIFVSILPAFNPSFRA